MRKISLIFSLFISLNLIAQVQPNNWCGSFSTEEEKIAQKERLLANLQTVSSGAVEFRDITYVPVKFHLVGRDDGSGRITEPRVFDVFCELNEDYAPYDIQFFLADGTFNYINNTSLYEDHLAVQNSVMEPNRDTRAINIFIVETTDDGNPDNGITLAYYHTIRDWIVSGKSSIEGDKIDITHEIGHFFSLEHTFYGWESESYLTINDPAPTTSSSGSIPTELMNGSNCQTSGDFICDTPPDYGFSNPCIFTANILDPNGVQVQPDETNYLSYFLACNDEDYHFSDTQNDVMHADYNSSNRNYLRIDPVPDYATINDTPELIYPAASATADYFNHVVFQWEAVSGADSYMIEISRVSSFQVTPIRQIVSGTSVTIEELDLNKKYYWRVKPFNPHIGCATPAATQWFQSGINDFTLVATKNVLDFVNEFSISPNPVSANQNLNIVLESQDSFTANLRLVDITGRLVNSINNKAFHVGENNIKLETSNLASGLYFLQLETDKGQITRKVVITN